MTATSPSNSLYTPFNLLALSLLIVLVAFGTYSYVAQENALYWSDFNFYQVAAWFTKESFLEKPLNLPILLFASTKLTHNLLYTLPLLPFYYLGDERWIYVLAVMIAYVVPYSLVLAKIAKQTATREQGLSLADGGQKKELAILFWTCVTIAFLTPTFPVIALRGYPDYAAALTVITAACIYLGDPKLSSWRRIMVIGLLLGLAPLLRRHYVYADMAFVLSAVIHHIAISRAGNTAGSWLTPVMRLAMIGVTAGLFLCTVGYLLVVEVVRHNYLTLYSSAYVPFSEGAGYFVTAYGVLAWVAAICGFHFAIKAGTLDKQRAVFVVVFASLLTLAWPALGKHVAVQYTLYAAPFVILGITFLLWTIWQKLRGVPRYAAVATVFTCLLFNTFVGFAPEKTSDSLPFHPTRFGMLTVPAQEGDSVSRLFSANYPPLVRNDIDEVFRLTDFLRKIAPNREPIFVAGWSDVMMPDVLKNAERRKYGVHDQRLNLLEAPFLDSRDTYPLERLLHSKYVMVAEPLRPSYKEESENVLKVVLACFEKHWELSKDFEKMPETFKLDHDSTITIYKRIRPTTLPVAIRTLEQMKKDIPLRPRAQPLWIATDDLSETTGDQSKENFKLSVNEGADTLSHYLLTCDPLPNTIMISGTITGTLPQGTMLECMTFDADGEEVGKNISKQAQTDESFSIQLRRDRASYLILFLRNRDLLGSDKPQQVTIEELKFKGP